MAAPERLQIGAVGERDLDLDEHVARAGLRVAGPPRARRSPGPWKRSRSHGVKTTFSAAPAHGELEPFGEALERQHRRLGHARARGGAPQPRSHVPRRCRARADRRSARGGRRRRTAVARVGEDEDGAARLDALRAARRRRARRRRPRSTGPSGARPRAAQGRSRRRTRRRRAGRARAEKSRPTKPLPTTSTRPRGTRSAPRSTHASGSTIRAARVVDRVRQLDAAGACYALREAAGHDRRRRETPRTVDSCPARQRSHSPHGRWWTSATRRRSPARATTSWPSTVPAGARAELLDVGAAEAAARARRTPVPAPGEIRRAAAVRPRLEPTARTGVS